jgi:hypothetical protein
MTFQRIGRAYQLRIRNADDLANVLLLDEPHWMAITAPINTLDIDATFLSLLDGDDDGRIRPLEVRQAIEWALEVLTDRTGLAEQSDALRPEHINAEAPDGQRIIEACRKIAMTTGDQELPVTLAEVRQIKATEESRAVSEMGVVLPEATKDVQLAQFLRDVIVGVGGEAHPSGKVGVTVGKLDEFLRDAKGLLDWQAAGRIPEGQTTTDIMPLGEATAPAYAAYRAIGDKIDQFFGQCDAVALDPSLRKHFGAQPAELASADLDDPAALRQVMADAPLAEPNAERTLALGQAINPVYADAMTKLRQATLEPILGQGLDTLTAAQWQQVTDKLAKHRLWAGSKVGKSLEALGGTKLQQYLEPQYAERVRQLVEQSRTTAFVLDNIRLVEKVILFQKHLIRFANNYVSFEDLYGRDRRALFDVGELVMDGRRFHLAVRVYDRAEHAKVATTSNIYVLYLQITGKNVSPYEVAVAVTSGGKGNLCIGKRGIFCDSRGNELDARVVQVIENPISLQEAMVAPFARLGKAIVGKIESVGASAEKQLDSAGGQVVTQVADAPQTTAAPQPAAKPQGQGVGGALAGGGIALAAVGSSMAYVSKTLAGLAERWPIILAVIAGAIAAVIVPTIIIAWVRLRKRDLSAMLEGSGWGINARMRLTGGLARFFTERPAYPLTAKGIRRHSLYWLIGVVILAAAGYAAWQLIRVAMA